MICRLSVFALELQGAVDPQARYEASMVLGAGLPVPFGMDSHRITSAFDCATDAHKPSKATEDDPHERPIP